MEDPQALDYHPPDPATRTRNRPQKRQGRPDVRGRRRSSRRRDSSETYVAAGRHDSRGVVYELSAGLPGPAARPHGGSASGTCVRVGARVFCEGRNRRARAPAYGGPAACCPAAPGRLREDVTWRAGPSTGPGLPTRGPGSGRAAYAGTMRAHLARTVAAISRVTPPWARTAVSENMGFFLTPMTPASQLPA